MKHNHFPSSLDGTCVEITDEICVVPIPTDWHGSPGYYFCHDRAPGSPEAYGGGRCTGGLAKHQVTGTLGQADFNVSPSILCLGQGNCGGIHGFIRDGKWVPA
jgi:hypothetical protein